MNLFSKFKNNQPTSSQTTQSTSSNQPPTGDVYHHHQQYPQLTFADPSLPPTFEQYHQQQLEHMFQQPLPNPPISSHTSIPTISSSIPLYQSKPGMPLFLCHPFVNATLVNGNLSKVTRLSHPIHQRYMDRNEWMAAHLFDLFYYANLFYGVISEYCTPQQCPMMSAGAGNEYIWIDSQKKSFKLPAPQYIDYVMTYIQNMIDDESIFPTKSGVEFPKDFHAHVRAATKQLFRVFAHIYHSHYDRIIQLSCEGHLNTLFAHFFCFCRDFELLEKKDYAPMVDFIQILERTGRV